LSEVIYANEDSTDQYLKPGKTKHRTLQKRIPEKPFLLFYRRRGKSIHSVTGIPWWLKSYVPKFAATFERQL
jgi:hypothetical protein